MKYLKYLLIKIGLSKTENFVKSHDDDDSKVFYMAAIQTYNTLCQNYPNFKPSICGSTAKILYKLTNQFDITNGIEFLVGDLDLIIEEGSEIPDIFVKTDKNKLGSGYEHYQAKVNGFPVCLFTRKTVGKNIIFGLPVQNEWDLRYEESKTDIFW